MKNELKERFLLSWKKYFGNAELPITFYYSDDDSGADQSEIPKGRRCLIAELAKVRKGRSIAFSADSLACAGAKQYLGYTDTVRPGFEYFLSCGNDQIEGERYIRTPELVKELMKNQKKLPAGGRNIVFKRWDRLTENDDPEIVIFFARPDVLSGLFTLANFDQPDPNGTIVPFGSGCGSIVHYPLVESLQERQRAVIGMFDPSARPYVPEDVLTFSVPVKRFLRMVDYMDESFLITETWSAIKKRISRDLLPGG
jgi:uncharacterized protein (DUF169 family)